MTVNPAADSNSSESATTSKIWKTLSEEQLQSIQEWDSHRLSFELSRLSPNLRDKVSEPVNSIRNMFEDWERLVRAMESGWEPMGTYPISVYPNDLENRDLLGVALSEISEGAREKLKDLLDELDGIFHAHTVPDVDGELLPWVRPPREAAASDRWRRKPRILPW